MIKKISLLALIATALSAQVAFAFSQTSAIDCSTYKSDEDCADEAANSVERIAGYEGYRGHVFPGGVGHGINRGVPVSDNVTAPVASRGNSGMPGAVKLYITISTTPPSDDTSYYAPGTYRDQVPATIGVGPGLNRGVAPSETVTAPVAKRGNDGTK